MSSESVKSLHIGLKTLAGHSSGVALANSIHPIFIQNQALPQ